MEKNWEKVKRVLTAAYEHVPYYNNVMNNAEIDPDSFSKSDFSEFFKLPLTTKDTIKSTGWVNFISNDCLDKNFRVSENGISMQYTSGTTGERMYIPWRKQDYLASVKNHWRIRAEHGISVSDVYGRDFHSREDWLCRKTNNVIYVNKTNMCDDTVRELIALLSENDAKWLYMAAGTMHALVRRAESLSLRFPKSIVYIENVGEPVVPAYRRKIEEHFGLPLWNMYGCTETNGIAFSCERGNLHLMDNNAYVEITDEEKAVGFDREGFVCVTGMFNTAMPMLRYRLNDRAVLRRGSVCSCGCERPVIELSLSRPPELIWLDDNELGEMIFPVSSLRWIQPGDGDVRFKVEYTGIKKYNMFVQPQSRYSESEIKQAVTKLLDRFELSYLNFDFIFGDYTPDRFKEGILKIR